MTTTPIPAEFAITGRRSVQLLRAWRARDPAAMNAVITECGTDATDVMVCLLGWLSDLLDRMPSADADAMLSDLLIDFSLDERGDQ